LTSLFPRGSLYREKDVKFALQVAVAAAVMLAIVAGLLAFGFSDFASRPLNDEIWQTRPRRPFARLAFSLVMISVTALLGGMLIRAMCRAKK
jgi:hypothetical protein